MTNEKLCERCNAPFIPSVHKTWQRFCNGCKLLHTKERKNREYQERKIYKTTVYLSPKEKKIITKYGLNLSKFVKQRLRELK